MAVRWSSLLFFVVSILVTTTPRHAQALLIPDASYQLGVSFQTSLEPTGVGSLTEGFCDSGSNGGCQSATATVDGIEASISGTQQCDLNVSCPTSTQATAQVSTALFYAVIDPANPTDTTTMVPLLFTASLTTSVSGPGTSADTSASGSIVWGVGDFIQGCTLLGASFCPSLGSNSSSDASVTDSPYSVQLNTVQRIDMTISGGTAWSAGGTGFSATLDPLVEIDPAFLLTHPGFSLEFSANIPTAATSVPEPASVAIFGTGLAALGVVRRKRKAS